MSYVSIVWRHTTYQTESDETTSNNKGFIINSQQPNHDEVQAVTAIKRVFWKLVTVNTMHAIELGMSQHQTIIQSKLTHLANCCSSNVPDVPLIIFLLFLLPSKTAGLTRVILLLNVLFFYYTN
jgi:hypothetical protein